MAFEQAALAQQAIDLPQWQRWVAQSQRHVPARSGRHAEHAAERGRGPAARANAGIGTGFAKGTELAQRDFRMHTRRCESCGALEDEHWRRRRDGDACGWCAGRRAERKRYIASQLRMAAALENGTRRLVTFTVEPKAGGGVQKVAWLMPREAVAVAVVQARARVAALLASPPRRGRPRGTERRAR